jgi:hypothetical protein
LILNNSISLRSESDYTSSGFLTISVIVVIVLIFLFATSNKTAAADQQQETASEQPRAPPAGFRTEYTSSTDGNFYNGYTSQKPVDGSSQWGSFMKGAAMGGAAGYLFSRRK